MLDSGRMQDRETWVVQTGLLDLVCRISAMWSDECLPLGPFGKLPKQTVLVDAGDDCGTGLRSLLWKRQGRVALGHYQLAQGYEVRRRWGGWLPLNRT